MHVLLFQLDVQFGAPDTNLQHILSELSKHELNSVDLVILPELFLTGYDKDSIHHVAENFDTFVAPLYELMQEFDFLLYGSLPEYSDGKYYNTAFLMHKDGILASYRKSHLFAPMGENLLFTSGRQVVVHSYALVDQQVSFGFSICYDLRFSELYNKLAKEGANVLLLSAEWPNTRINHWRLLVQARAIENQCFVIALNRVGVDPDYRYGGHSMIVDPFGEIITELSDIENVTSAAIDLIKVSKFKTLFDVQQDKWL